MLPLSCKPHRYSFSKFIVNRADSLLYIYLRGTLKMFFKTCSYNFLRLRFVLFVLSAYSFIGAGFIFCFVISLKVSLYSPVVLVYMLCNFCNVCFAARFYKECIVQTICNI